MNTPSTHYFGIGQTHYFGLLHSSVAPLSAVLVVAVLALMLVLSVAAWRRSAARRTTS